MPRGLLVDVRTLLLVNGKKVPTFRDCDEAYLEDKGLEIGDVVSFEYVGNKEAAEIEKATPTAKERALQQKAKQDRARAVVPASELEAALISSGVIVGATAAELASARKAVEDLDDDDAAYRFLSELPSAKCPAFTSLDFEVSKYHLSDLNQALGGEPALRASAAKGGNAKVSFVAKGKSLATHDYKDTLTLLQWIQAQLDEHRCDERRLYFLPCHEAYAVLFVSDAQCEQLREGDVPIEREPPLP